MTGFFDFIDQVPDGVMQRTETYLCSNIALFKPLVYMGGVRVRRFGLPYRNSFRKHTRRAF